jgi:hypothetical protein
VYDVRYDTNYFTILHRNFIKIADTYFWLIPQELNIQLVAKLTQEESTVNITHNSEYILN